VPCPSHVQTAHCEACCSAPRWVYWRVQSLLVNLFTSLSSAQRKSTLSLSVGDVDEDFLDSGGDPDGAGRFDSMGAGMEEGGVRSVTPSCQWTHTWEVSKPAHPRRIRSKACM